MPDKSKINQISLEESYVAKSSLTNHDCAEFSPRLGGESSDNKTASRTSENLLAKRKIKKALDQKTTVVEYRKVMGKTGEDASHGYFFSFSDPHNLKRMVQKKSYTSFLNFRLSIEAHSFRQTARIDKLISVDAIRVKLVPYDFQLRTALQVINEMNGNAILADEVGLGKTIEAGLIMKEMLLREEISSVLIVSPKSLLTQWKAEMDEKFGEDFEIANNHRNVNIKTDNRIICSHGFLTRKYDEFASRTWDLIVVDEAHVFRNLQSKGRTCIANLRKNHFLLLTATPLCNKLTDLYSIVDLLQPGILDSERSFVSRFAKDAKSRVVKPENSDCLRRLVQGLMCRTRREQTGIPFTKRHVESRTLDADKSEREFIDRATQYLRDISHNHFKTIETLIAENPSRKISASQSNAILVFQAIALQQSFSSSPEASIQSLKKRQQRFPAETQATDSLIGMAKQIQTAKLKLLRKVLDEIPNEQAIIFCLRKTTAHRLKEVLNQEFGAASVYLGDMSQNQLEGVLHRFRDGKVRYLVATDTAAEGLNLQNCCILFNYDLHWNPMKIEQRIGRIHRYKQERDVTIFNLAIKDTIDDYVLHILYQKIDLFTMTIGKMETVLAELKEGSQDIQKTIMNILIRNSSHISIKQELERLASDLIAKKKSHELAETFTQGVLG
ncbi:MAG: DEAD/DEAH box helicase [Candidatus Bathyarchaeota archaeon]|nr:DEAD/DEAH box helicase [Candidatus Bathyarchaeota archaeon]